MARAVQPAVAGAETLLVTVEEFLDVKMRRARQDLDSIRVQIWTLNRRYFGEFSAKFESFLA
jgi:hypothetical protein